MRAVPALLLVLFAAGCNSAAKEDSEEAPKPKAVAFEGTLDSKFVGLWSTPKGASVLDLHADGSARIDSAIPRPGGTAKSSVNGKWLVSGNELLLQYTIKDRAETTLKYPAKVTATELTIDKSSRSKVVYKRQSVPAPK